MTFQSPILILSRLWLLLITFSFATATRAESKPDHRALVQRYRSLHNQRTLPPLVLRFIEATFLPSDDSDSFVLGDVISSRDSLLSPFYFHVLNQLVWDTQMNASFSEVTGAYQIRILVNNPRQVLHELMSRNTGTHESPSWQTYARELGEEISFEDNKLSDSEFYDSNQIHLESYDDLRRIVLSKCSSKKEQLFCSRFFGEVKRAWKYIDAHNN